MIIYILVVMLFVYQKWTLRVITLKSDANYLMIINNINTLCLSLISTLDIYFCTNNIVFVRYSFSLISFSKENVNLFFLFLFIFLEKKYMKTNVVQKEMLQVHISVMFQSQTMLISFQLIYTFIYTRKQESSVVVYLCVKISFIKQLIQTRGVTILTL